MGKRTQDGFTMVELLVVIAVIAMLVAILLPAVNSAREAARNTQCKNRIRHVAMAGGQYAGRMRSFPGFRGLLDDVPISWVVRIAPDFEERNLYEMWRSGDVTQPGNVYLAPPYISVLVCPSDPSIREDGPSLSYMANAGRAGVSPQFNLPQFGVFLDQMPQSKGAPIPATTEAFISDQGDGMDHTIMVAENIQLALSDGQPGTRYDTPNPKNDEWSQGNKMSNVVVYHPVSNPSPVASFGGDPRADRRLTPEAARPASNHPGGVNVAFCGQRVVFIRNDVNYRVYMRLMMPHDQGAIRIDSACANALGSVLAPLSSADYE